MDFQSLLLAISDQKPLFAIEATETILDVRVKQPMC